MPIPDADPIVNIPLVTPFESADEVDHDALSRNIERWLETPAGGFLVGSQTGEEWSLSQTEKNDIVRTVAQTLNGQRYVMAGIDCPSVTETLHQADEFAAAGAELLRIRKGAVDLGLVAVWPAACGRCSEVQP